MMQDNSEERMFKELLGDYAAPAKDNGFSQAVLSSLPKADNRKRVKSWLVGGAGALGAALAGMQLPGLWAVIKGIKAPTLPVVERPEMNLSALDASGLFSTSYGMWAVVLMALVVIWMGQSVLLGDDA